MCCVISFPFSTWLAAATDTTVVRSKHQCYSICKRRCNYCSYSWAVPSTAGAVIAIAIAIVWGFISNYLLLRVLHLPTTLLSLLRLLPRRAAVVTACRRYHCGVKNVSQQYYIFLFHFASAMMIVSLTANATATTMAIDHCLFYDSNKTIVAIIYFPFFSWWKWWENLWMMKEMDGERRRGCCCFCNDDVT